MDSDYTPASPEQRDAIRGKRSTTQERVMKWFTDADRIAAIKGTQATVTIGSGPEAREVVIRPLNPRQFANAYLLIKQIFVPIVNLYKVGQSAPSFAELADALGDNVDKIPELIGLILSRGNAVSREWIDEHCDLFLDLQLILPPFFEQNGLWKMIAGNDTPLPSTNGHAQVAEMAQVTEELAPQ